MILIRLLGRYKKAMGCSSLKYRKHPASINEIVSYLDGSVSGYNTFFKRDNFLIVVNGVDSSLLDANESLVRDGDIVTVIPIIHGG
ncbi:MAG: MoaD/ThiS family protein [Nitrososphaeraceae archaeon]